jgi:2,3-diphosphopglycerate-independent phosphoglycerate mutase
MVAKQDTMHKTTPSTSSSKVLLVLIDGVGDVALSDIHAVRASSRRHTTPLALSCCPVLDRIAASGLNGLIDPVEPGLACGSDTAHLSLFGYDPRVVYRGRGAFESLGAGMAMGPGDIAFKSNFAVLDEATMVVTSRRADRCFEEEGPVLCGALDGETVEVDGDMYRMHVRYATEHRCGVVVRAVDPSRGVMLTDRIEGTDPLKDGLVLKTSVGLDVEDAGVGEEELERQRRTARVVNAVSDRMRSILREHPLNKERERNNKPAANVVLLRGCGSLLDLESFEEKHGMRACMVAPTKIIAGLGTSIQMDVLEVPGATGDYRSNFRNKAVCMARALCSVDSAYQFGFLHIKAVDDASHDRDVPLKISCLEVVDAMLGQLIKALREASDGGDLVVGITGDHSTPVEFGDHSHEPVPIVMSTLKDIMDAIGEGVVDSIGMDDLPLPHEVLALSSEERVERYFPWKRGVMNISKKNFNTRGDAVDAFSEVESAKGCLGRFPGNFVVPTLVQLGYMAASQTSVRPESDINPSRCNVTQ